VTYVNSYDHTVNYTTISFFFDGIANIDAIFVWFVCNKIVVRIAGSHVWFGFYATKSQPATSLLHAATLTGVRVAQQSQV